MSTVNEVFLLGRLGADARTRQTGGGRTVSRFSVATERRRQAEDGSWQAETDWHRVAVWQKAAPGEGLDRHLLKGQRVHVQGRLRTRSWEDPDTRERRWLTEVVAQAFQVALLGDPRGREGGGARAAAEPPPPPAAGDPGGDDIPF